MSIEIDIKVTKIGDAGMIHTLRRKIVACDSETQAAIIFTVLENMCIELGKV